MKPGYINEQLMSAEFWKSIGAMKATINMNVENTAVREKLLHALQDIADAAHNSSEGLC